MTRENQETEHRQAIIAARAFFDASEYLKIIQAMPEDQRSTAELDAMAGDSVFAKARAELKMGAEEMKYYLGKMLERVAELKKSQK